MKYTGTVELVKVDGRVGIQSDDGAFRQIGLKMLGKLDRLRVNMTIENIKREKSFSQLASVWVLVTILFEAMEGRKPTVEEKQGLYLDILEAYADRVPTMIGNKTRPIHLSESSTYEAAKVIEGLIIELANMGIQSDLQADVKRVVTAWHAYRGQLDADPLDSVTEREFRERNPVCMACLVGGDGLQLAHIVSRGANGAIRSEPWNWMILCDADHRYQHAEGWRPFMRKYPHLQGRFERAHRMEGS
jgi:hypothetical protein